MPLIHDPEDPKGGPLRRRRKKKTKPTQQQQQDPLIGEDLLDFHDESIESPTPIKPSLETSSKKKKRAAKGSNNAEPMPKRNSVRRGEEHTSNASSTTRNHAHVTPIPLVTGGFANMTRSVPRVRHALAVDTRALDTQEGLHIFHSTIRQEALDFLRVLAKRGAAPCILACFTQKTTFKSSKSPRGSSNARAAIQATAMRTESNTLLANLEGDSSDDTLLQPVPIRPPVNAKNVQNRKAVHVPKRMLAHDSWKLFGDLVEAVVKEDTTRVDDGEDGFVPPLDVTILTSDVSFLCDTKQDCHKRGLNRLWERVRPLFENNSIRTVEICCAETGLVVLSNANADKKDNGKANDDDDNKKSSTNDGENDTIVVDENAGNEENGKNGNTNAGEKKQGEDEQNEPLLEPDGDDSQSNHNAASVKCIQGIKLGLSTRAEADYKKTRSMEDPPPSVSVAFSTFSCDRLGYHTLVQKWLNELLALTCEKGIVSFELPENVDGMQCALSFEATYKVFPFRVDSIQASMAMTDLRLLSQSKFEVLKLIPLSCVDGSLLFGTPMEVCAKLELENDLAQYTEMKALVGLTLQYLNEKDVALVLRATDTEPTSTEPSLQHQDGQTFLLMAKDVPTLLNPSQRQSKTVGDFPSSGMLMRYAIAEQLLDSTSTMPATIEGYEPMAELGDFLSSSMDSVETSSSNLLVDYALMKNASESPTSTDDQTQPTVASQESDTSMSDEDVQWMDKEGVGSRVAQAEDRDDDDRPMDDDMSDSDESFTDMYNNAFNSD